MVLGTTSLRGHNTILQFITALLNINNNKINRIRVYVG